MSANLHFADEQPPPSDALDWRVTIPDTVGAVCRLKVFADGLFMQCVNRGRNLLGPSVIVVKYLVKKSVGCSLRSNNQSVCVIVAIDVSE